MNILQTSEQYYSVQQKQKIMKKKKEIKSTPKKFNSSKTGVYEVSLMAADFRTKPRQYITKSKAIHHKIRTHIYTCVCTGAAMHCYEKYKSKKSIAYIFMFFEHFCSSLLLLCLRFGRKICVR